MRKTYKYDEFIKENGNFEKVGFRVPEYEDETIGDIVDDQDNDQDNEQNIDELGEGEPVEVDTETNTDTQDDTQIDTIDLDGVDNSTESNIAEYDMETINTYMDYINDQVAAISKMAKKSETVPLDDATKSKIISVYSAIQGI